jgi:DNA replication protein DnaC
MTTNVSELSPVLKKLRLSGVLQTLDLRIREAVDQNLGHTDFLLRLCSDEAQRRDGKQLEQRLRRANFESAKRLDDFEWSFNPQVPRAKVIDLATCSFVGRKENVLLIGPTGVGKSHLAQAIGERACRQGHSACYVTAHQMLSQLRAARADQTLERRMLRFTEPDLLVVDDLGLRPLESDEPIDLYEVIRRRYERGSMVITSNRAVEEWHPLFLDDLMASAAMDRLLHHSHVVVMEGRSYRARGREQPEPQATVGRQSGRQSRRPASDEP